MYLSNVEILFETESYQCIEPPEVDFIVISAKILGPIDNGIGVFFIYFEYTVGYL